MEALGHFFNASIVTKTWCFLLPRPNKISQLPSSMQNCYTSCSPARIKGAAASHQLSCQSLMDWQGWESCSKVSREHNSSELSRDEEGWQWLLVYTQIMETSEKKATKTRTRARKSFGESIWNKMWQLHHLEWPKLQPTRMSVNSIESWLQAECEAAQ